MKNKIHIIIGTLVFIIFSCLTIGYASYNKILNVGGNITLKPQGKIRISNVVLTSHNNLATTDVPTFTDNSIDFNLHFSGSGQNDTYFAEYEITMDNDTFYDYEFASSSFSPNLNTGDTSNAEIDYTLEGISVGDIIARGESKTFTVRIDLTPLDDSGEYDASGSLDTETESKPVGSLLGSLPSDNIGDLSGNNSVAQYTVTVINSYSYARTFTFTTASGSEFEVVGSDGGALGEFTIDGGATESYNIYLKTSNTTGFATSPQKISIMIRSNGLEDKPSGVANVTVDIDESLIDNDAPLVSGVSGGKNGTNNSATVTWSGTDENSISNYTVIAYTVSNNTLTEAARGTTNADETTYTFTDLSDGTYVFKVYGTDELGNTATQEEIESAKTSEGHASASPQVSLVWTYTVKTDFSNMSSNGASTVKENATYTATLSADDYYTLPTEITVKMGGKTLESGTDYTYTRSSGKVSIPNVTGNLVISGTARNSCLVEGTKITLANGKTKNIEDITYFDLLKVWSYDSGSVTYEYPIWIEKKDTSESYQETKFSDGSILKTTGFHGVYDVNRKEFISVDDYDKFKVGTEIAKIEDNKIKKIKVVSIKTVHKKVNYYHVISTRYYNIIANDILTTDGTTMLSNLYGFEDDIKWPENRKDILKNNKYSYSELNILPYYMFKGLRAEEAKVLVSSKIIDLDSLKMYFLLNQVNQEMLKEPIKNKKGTNLWLVTNNREKITKNNIKDYAIEEGKYYTLPKYKNVKEWYNTSDNITYKPGDKVEVWHGMHFIAK